MRAEKVDPWGKLYRLLTSHIGRAALEVTGRWEGSVPKFNDAPDTTHRIVLAVLIRARENIASELAADA